MGYDTAVITITDTGKRRTNSVSAEETDIVNSGSSITLYGTQLTLDVAALLNTSPAIGKLNDNSDNGSKYAYSEIDHLGSDTPKWILQGVLDLNSSSDRTTLSYLRDLVRTKGYKELGGDLPDLIDGTDDSSSINVRIISIRIAQQAAHNIITYTINMVETT